MQRHSNRRGKSKRESGRAVPEAGVRGDSAPQRRPEEANGPDDPLRPWLLGAACALLIARPLYPSEAAAPRGDGLPMVMLWIALVVVWLLGVIGRPRFRVRFGWTDAAVTLLVLLHTVAAVWGAVHGSPRPAVNMLWEWIAYGLAFFSVRQLVVGPKETRAVAAIMVALAVALASHGLYQYAYEMPATRAEYRDDPNQALRRAGLWYEENSPERKLFEDRLRSVEPMASFALTNSLAGYLAPWLIVAAGIGVGGRLLAGTDEKRLDRKRRWILGVGFGLAIAVIAACLLLTKSRSGYLASLAGLALLALFGRRGGRRIGWKVPVAVATLIVALAAGAVMIRGLDREVLSEATKSLGYRAQYWQSTLRIIADYPWLGCGPGNFQEDYTRYKLPQASEEIADPHNVLLEVWATAGTPTMLALLAVLGSFGFAVVRHNARLRSDAAQTTASAPENGTTADRPAHALAGMVLGFLLAVPIGLMSEAPPGMAVLFVGLPSAAATIAVLLAWIRGGRLPDWLPAIGIVVLLVNLLAAGGIGFPGVAGTLWLLLALGLHGAQPGEARSLPRIVGAAGLVLAVGLAFACYGSAYRPVLEARAAVRAAEQDPARAMVMLETAAEADPLWVEPRLQLARLAFDAWQTAPSAAALERFEHAMAAAHRLAPRSSSLWLNAGDRFADVFAKTGQRQTGQKAVDAYRRAVDMYPHSGTARAKLALSLQAIGDEAGFDEQAARAIELDHLTPHLDKKLPEELRNRLLRNSSR